MLFWRTAGCGLNLVFAVLAGLLDLAIVGFNRSNCGLYVAFIRYGCWRHANLPLAVTRHCHSFSNVRGGSSGAARTFIRAR